MSFECTSESWITVDITKCRETIPHIRTANRKCMFPTRSAAVRRARTQFGYRSGCWRSEM